MTTAAQPADARIELLIGGMTCASCAARIEKKLNRIDGVAASVNYATEKAVVSAPSRSTPRSSSTRSRRPDTPRRSRIRPHPTASTTTISATPS